MSLGGKEVEIIVGTYEDYVVGYQLESVKRKKCKTVGDGRKKQKANDNLDYNVSSLEQTFAVRSHSGSVKCLTCSSNGSLVFSCGQDETMNLFNLTKRKLLQTTEGAITCATFVESSHLICGSEDSNIYIYECTGSNMKLVKTLKGHKASLTSVDAHPSGKILLSLSKDKTMRTWNLIKGRCAYVTSLNIDAQIVKWSRDGEQFVITSNDDLYLYNNMGNLTQRIKLEKRINSIEFITENTFVVAIDSGKLEFFDLTNDDCKSVMKFNAHESRIKSVKCIVNSHNEDSQLSSSTKEVGAAAAAAVQATTTATIQFATVSSEGVIKLWSTAKLKDRFSEPCELASADVGARVTCMIATVRRIYPNEE